MKLKISAFLSLILMLTFALSLNASEKIKLGVLDLEDKNVSQSTAQAVSEILRTELFNTGRFTIVDKKNMERILKEQAFQKTGCTSSECAVEVGRILNTNGMINGSVSKVGNTLITTISLTDVETGEVTISDSVQSASEDKLPVDVSRLVQNFSNKVPVVGKVVKATETEVVVDLGAVDNVSNGMKFIVNRLKEEIKDASGRVIMKEYDEVGEIELFEVQQQASKAKIVSKKKSFNPGDIVKIGETVEIKKELPKINRISYSGAEEHSVIGAMWRSTLLPGWGQFYNKDDLGGWVFTVGEAAALALSVIKYLDYTSAYDQYNKSTDSGQIENLYQNANSKYQDFKGPATAAVVIWAVNILDSMLFFNPKATDKAALDYGSGILCEIDPAEMGNIKVGYTYTW